MDAPDAPTVALQILDVVGVFAFGLSGGLAAVRQRFDLLGVLVLAAAAGLGGGILRDVLIGDTPPVGITAWWLLAAAGAAGLVTFAFHPGVRRIQGLVQVLDAVGLGVFAIAGTLKALELGHSALTAVIVGVLTGVGGGVVRDLLAGDTPHVLAQEELYAIPAAMGAVLFASVWWAGIDQPWVAGAAAVLIILFRLAALRWDWRAPAPRLQDLAG